MQSTLTAWLRQPTRSVNEPQQDATSSNPGTSLPVEKDLSTSNMNPRRPLPDTVTIEPCSSTHVDAFRRLNAVLLPIPYPAKFYDEMVNDKVTGDITRVAVWHDQPTASAKQSPSHTDGKVVAGVRCRLLQNPNDADRPVLYISTLGTLAPYRGHGLACHLLAQVTRNAITMYGTASIMAHAWEANEEGLEWYKRRGFRVDRREEGYYRRLAPKSAALVVVKDIVPSDLIALGIKP